jgi:hypothetical protein
VTGLKGKANPTIYKENNNCLIVLIPSAGSRIRVKEQKLNEDYLSSIKYTKESA